MQNKTKDSLYCMNTITKQQPFLTYGPTLTHDKVQNKKQGVVYQDLVSYVKLDHKSIKIKCNLLTMAKTNAGRGHVVLSTGKDK
jgi:hypothetical protein